MCSPPRAFRLRLPFPWVCSVGRLAARCSRALGMGAGSVVAGRVVSALRPDALGLLSAHRSTAVVTGTNGKTTTSHLLAAALGEPGGTAHNAAGSNMTDGAVSALLSAPSARRAVLEVDELHLGEVLGPSKAAVVVVLNVTRDQLDRVAEVRSVAGAIRSALAAAPGVLVVANADDPMVVWAVADHDGPVVWVEGTGGWDADTRACPACGATVLRGRAPSSDWRCSGCSLGRPVPAWRWSREQGTADVVVHHADAPTVVVPLRLPGRANGANAVMALAAASALGVSVESASPRLAVVEDAAGRWAVVSRRGRRIRVLLVKNPAGWRAAVDVLAPEWPVVLAVNAREADGRDVSWLWDLGMTPLRGRAIVAAGERAADVGVRLGYAEIGHLTEPDPLAAVDLLPAGDVEVLANYTAFVDLRARWG